MCSSALPSLNPFTGPQKTIEAVASQMPAGALETLQSVATQMPAGVMETAVTALTEVVPGDIIKTAQSGLGTEGFDSILPKNTPQDIPVPVDGNVIVSTDIQVQIQSSASFQDVLSFYQREMPVNGWRYEDKGSTQSSDSATLKFKKDDRLATITIVDLVVTRMISIDIGKE
jgi:hypothetical protein